MIFYRSRKSVPKSRNQTICEKARTAGITSALPYPCLILDSSEWRGSISRRLAGHALDCFAWTRDLKGGSFRWRLLVVWIIGIAKLGLASDKSLRKKERVFARDEAAEDSEKDRLDECDFTRRWFRRNRESRVEIILPERVTPRNPARVGNNFDISMKHPNG